MFDATKRSEQADDTPHAPPYREDMLEVDFAGGRIVRVGNQSGVGRR